MTPKIILFLGATGFVGKNLALKLLNQGHRLLCLVRPRLRISGWRRLWAAWRPAFPEGSIAGLIKDRLQVAEGDLTLPGLGLPEAIREQLRQEVDEVWHCAARLSFVERDREELERCHVRGLENLLALIRGSRIKRLNYLSTAYVAGCRRGLITEQILEEAPDFRNAYEHTKWQAEKLLESFARKEPLTVTLYRPGIIVGGQRPGSVPATGLYRAAALIGRIAAQYGIRHRGWRLRIPGPEEGGLNLVPLSYVVEALTALAAVDHSGVQVFHLVNPRPLPNREVVGAIGDALGLTLKLAGPADFQEEPMMKPERVLANAIRSYLPYLRDRLLFDDTNTRRALAGTGLFCPPMTREKLAGLLSYALKGLKPGRARASARQPDARKAGETWACPSSFPFPDLKAGLA